MNYQYLNISVRITIDKQVQFTTVESIILENTTEKFSDTAKITLPREFKNVSIDGRSASLVQRNIKEFIKVGDTIKIEAGYNQEYTIEFEGYITEIGADIPLVLQCEDQMYILKKQPKINHTFKSVTLENLIKFIAPGYKVQALEMPLGKFMVSNATPYKVIQELKQRFGIRCYFKGKTLVAGLAIDFKPEKNHLFVFGKNIRSSSSLKYESKHKQKRYYKGISLQKGTSKKVTYSFGDVDGDHRTLHLPLNLNEAQVKQWVLKTYNDMVFDGYKGSIDSWGIPKTKAGDSASIIDPNYPDKHRDMTLFIEKVMTTIDSNNGFKRENKLSFKIK
jgi:hypothetical protein